MSRRTTPAADTAARILDANLNRLAEGIRVIEDICRFGLEDAPLAAALKRLRHGTRELRRALPDGLLQSRDSAKDVGRVEVKESTHRADLNAILGAAFGRSTEALRALEEVAKLDWPHAATLAKALRYEVYELEKNVVPLFDRRVRAERIRGLYLILSNPAAGYEALAEAAVAARVAAIQLREKKMESGPLLALARRLRAITAGSRTLFFINDRPDIARLCEADGVHVGQNDLTVAEARAIAGDGMLIGKSTHNARELAAALRERPDYVGIGPVFGTTSKDRPDPTLGLEKAENLLKKAAVPAVGIGGITAENLPSLLGAGFRSYALIAAINASPQPLKAIRRLQRLEKG